MEGTSNTQWTIIKLGGTSMASATAWRALTKHLKLQTPSNAQRTLLVCSALSGITNQITAWFDLPRPFNTQEKIANFLQPHYDLATELNIDHSKLFSSLTRSLEQELQAFSDANICTAKQQAKLLAHGELFSTTLGHAFLQSQFSCQWQDARELLQAIDKNNHDNNYLAAHCDTQPNTSLSEYLNSLQPFVIITQGFIARNKNNETVTLGRGGSDTSAAYLASGLSAKSCEIWTDVSGIYTANPQQIPAAKLLKNLDYDEAQEIASMGAKVLHPRCIAPLKENNIPIIIRHSEQPSNTGTTVSLSNYSSNLPIKAVITRYNVLLINITSLTMWQQVGFLADVFQCVKEHRLSIDLISTSESSVTLSLDGSHHPVDTTQVDALLKKLNEFSKATLVGPCASISLVGQNIRRALHQLSGAFELFKSQQIHLLSQAANDLNLTVVVDQNQAERLSKKLHTKLIDHNPHNYDLGPSWQDSFGKKIPVAEPWWQRKKAMLEQLAQKKSPIYVYDQATLEQSASHLLKLNAVNHIFYAIKANSNADILKTFYAQGLGFECVSQQEVEHVLSLFPQINRSRILFTPNFADKSEYQFAFKEKVHVTIDSLYPLKSWPDVFYGQKIIARLDPGYGLGHHKHVVTGGNDSKFGIPMTEIDLLKQLTEEKTRVVGLHAHSGSGILEASAWQSLATQLMGAAEHFPDVTIINLGGGLGIVERPGQTPLNLDEINQALNDIKTQHPQYELWIEPGRFLVAEAGVLLAKVTQTKTKGSTHFIGLNAGMNSLIRPALYGAYHPIFNLSQLDQPNAISANIVGPICESGDILGYQRRLPSTKENDIILIANAGAYGYTMASTYNLRQPAQEVFVNHQFSLGKIFSPTTQQA